MSEALELGLIADDAVAAKSQAARQKRWGVVRDDVARLGRYYSFTSFDISLPLDWPNMASACRKKPIPYGRSPKEVAVMRYIKQALDPKDALNPGAIFD